MVAPVAWPMSHWEKGRDSVTLFHVSHSTAVSWQLLIQTRGKGQSFPSLDPSPRGCLPHPSTPWYNTRGSRWEMIPRRGQHH